MENRTVQVKGWAWGTDPITITATLAGNTVFSGTVTLNGDTYPGVDVVLKPDHNALFSFDIPLETTGTFPMTITSTSGAVLLGPVVANYNTLTWVKDPAQPNTDPRVAIDDYQPGTSTGFVTISSNGTDPRSNISIDGTAQTFTDQVEWRQYMLAAGSTFACDLTIAAGNIAV